MAKVSPRTLSGFMELPPKEQMKMEAMMEILRRSYSLYGFTPLDTPSRSTAFPRARAIWRCALI